MSVFLPNETTELTTHLLPYFPTVITAQLSAFVSTFWATNCGSHCTTVGWTNYAANWAT